MNIKRISDYIINKIPDHPQFGIVLGSGLGKFIDIMDNKLFISYSEIFGFSNSSKIAGHVGEWVFGYIKGNPIICANGRFHIYEGYKMEIVTLLISVIHSIGCGQIIITNAAGCLKRNWKIGDLMLIKGYIDYSFTINKNVPKVVSIKMDNNKLNKIRLIANNLGIRLREGIYTWSLGPSYETPAEVKDIISLGGNAVGMSTVPELIKAVDLKIDIIGISCLTNYGSGMEGIKLTHSDVLEVSKKSNQIFSKMLKELIIN